MQSETHTTDLTCSCKRQRQLTLEGKALGYTETALFRGNLGHGALETLHRDFDPDLWDSDIGSACCDAGLGIALEKSESDGRPISTAVDRDQIKLRDEVEKHVQHYIVRLKEYFKCVTLIGVEVPIRCPIEVDGEVEQFASHMDLVGIGPDWWNEHSEFTVKVWDWKFKAESPSPYLIERHPQLGAYAYAVTHGTALVDGQWIKLEGQPISVAIVDMMRMKPYMQKTKGKDSDGNEVQYVKGDHRPLNRIIHSREIGPAGMARWKHDFEDHVRMKRLGIWPKSPDAIGCDNCDVRVHCEGYSI